MVKKMARYLVGSKRVVWEFEWQDEPEGAEVFSDSDWGGNCRDRRSTSGGVWMLGGHCIKTWSATQGAYALSSAEAELYGMVEAVTRAKGEGRQCRADRKGRSVRVDATQGHHSAV